MKDLLVLFAHLLDDDRQASGSRWHQSHRRRQPVDEAAASCYQSLPATRAQSLCIGSVPVRVVVAISRQTPHSSGCRSYQAVDAFSTSRLAQEAKVSTAVFVWPKTEAGAQRSFKGTRRGDRRTEATQPALWLPPNRSASRRRIRGGYRQGPGQACPRQTLPPNRRWQWAVMADLFGTHEGQPLEH
mgnify:CR=1 FL=1